MPGLRIKDEDRKNIDKKFLCTSCTQLLNNPMQTMCGHLMCYECVQIMLGGSDPICPEDGTELKRENVFTDAFTKRELKKLRLHCPHPGCNWHGSYDDLEGHTATCDYAMISCVHTQCRRKFLRSYLGQHLRNECEYRNVKCDFCHAGLAFASLQEHVDTNCPAAPVTCRYCKTEVLRRNIEEHETQSCDEILANCDFQAIGCNHKKATKRRDLRQHMNDRMIYHVNLLLSFGLNFVSQLQEYTPRAEFLGTMQTIRDEVNKMHVGLTARVVGLYEKFTGLERRVDVLETSGGASAASRSSDQELQTKISDLNVELTAIRERFVTLERKFHDVSAASERMRSRLDQADESLALNTVKIADIESSRKPAQQAHSHNGTLLWTIDHFQRKRQDAISGAKAALYSPHFYSSQYGYKMCAKIYMNGDGFGKNSHLSLFFVVMKGEYDALQTWPFQKKITMMLLDQGSGDHMIDAFHSDPQSSSFQRPKADMNIASGSPLFMPLDSLNNRAYVKDDVLFVKIIVD